MIEESTYTVIMRFTKYQTAQIRPIASLIKQRREEKNMYRRAQIGIMVLMKI
jgi:hypothetical protein